MIFSSIDLASLYFRITLFIQFDVFTHNKIRFVIHFPWKEGGRDYHVFFKKHGVSFYQINNFLRKTKITRKKINIVTKGEIQFILSECNLL